MNPLVGLIDDKLRFYITLLRSCRPNVFRNLSCLVTRLDRTRNVHLSAMAESITTII